MWLGTHQSPHLHREGSTMRAQHRLLLLAATLCALACPGAARRKEKPPPAAQRFSKLAKDADDAIAANRNEEGVKLLDQALELMESAGAGAAEGDLRFNRGAALKKLERFDEALADFQVTIRLNPKGSVSRTLPRRRGRL